MKKIDNLNDIKNLETKILVSIHNFCQKNNINYSLCYGTLLGAVRHKGFIPWDDDIDIMMPRADYELFIKTFSDDRYKLASNSDKRFYYPFVKIYDSRTVLIENGISFFGCGVNVDVFPIDNLPDEKKIFVRLLKKIRFYQHLLMNKYSRIKTKKGISKKMLCLAIKIASLLISKNFLSKRIDKMCRKINSKYSNSQRCGCIVWGEDTDFYPKSLFYSYSSVVFENSVFKCVNDYDYYLKTIYGEYMVLPDPEKRVSNHSFEAFYNSYEETDFNN